MISAKGPSDALQTKDASNTSAEGADASASRLCLAARLRRGLTPREYARLQGFPDAFKLHHMDSKAYRQLGNSVAVPVVRAVAERVIAALRGKRPGR